MGLDPSLLHQHLAPHKLTVLQALSARLVDLVDLVGRADSLVDLDQVRKVALTLNAELAEIHVD